MTRLPAAFRNFLAETRGNVAVEAVLFLPMMAWVFIFFTVFWDAYRVQSLAQKATFTIADVLSRERAQVVPNYAKSFVRVFNYAAEVPGNPNVTNFSTSAAAVRISALTFSDGENAADASDDSVTVAWSISSDTARLPMLDNTTVQTIRNRVPALIDGDSIIVVETRLRWQPKFTTAMSVDLLGDSAANWFSQQDIDSLATVRPRFVPKMCFNNSTITAAGANVACAL